MGELMLVTSGKGGVGKSTVSFYTGLALALRGRKVLIIELDTGLRSLEKPGTSLRPLLPGGPHRAPPVGLALPGTGSLLRLHLFGRARGGRLRL